ncbi:MAG: hypothetical protein IID45_11190, partial [Planctomycetes bacterium]|nr:hypothetical protein [Planctomycetota bacterium]
MSPMTNISKCLAVLATVASLAYLGVVSVSVVGGPNYDANFDDPNLSDVKLTKKVEEETGKANYHVDARR